MNMKTTIAHTIAVLCSVLLYTTATAATSEEVLAQRVENLHSIVEMRYTSTVEHYVEQYTERYPSTSQILLGQASVYFPLIENIIRDKDMPEELKYLAVIESGLRPAAKSRVGATGIWQFMRSTGKMYGLTINSTIDERKDVIKSTHAAMDYLKDLHSRFGNWTVALAAYNCGPGNVRRAMRKAGGATDYWSIQKYLPRETRRYVPKFIAMQYLMSYYHMHDIVPELPEQKLRFLAATKVYDKVTFKELSLQTGLEPNLIKSLNPSYLRFYIPANAEGTNTLTLPEDELFLLLSQESTVSFDDLVFTRSPREVVVESTQVAQPRELESTQPLPLSSISLGVERKTASAVIPPSKATGPNGRQSDSEPDSYVSKFRAWANKN